MTSVVQSRTEHAALNVANPVALVQWYVSHLRMQVVRQGGPPAHAAFVGDSGRNFMLELTCNTGFPMLGLPQLNHMSFHIAFMAENIEQTRNALQVAGATVVEDILQAPNGDKVLMMRDPWGVALQFVNRDSPMLTMNHLRPEHIAFNVSDSRSQARWYVDHLGWKVKREGGAPTYGMFLGDASDRIMVELYQNDQFPMIDLFGLNPMSLHLASMVPNVVNAREVLQNAGATIEEDVTTTPGGDQVLMLRDPWGLPIQFVKRSEPMVES